VRVSRKPTPLDCGSLLPLFFGGRWLRASLLALQFQTVGQFGRPQPGNGFGRSKAR